MGERGGNNVNFGSFYGVYINLYNIVYVYKVFISRGIINICYCYLYVKDLFIQYFFKDFESGLIDE